MQVFIHSQATFSLKNTGGLAPEKKVRIVRLPRYRLSDWPRVILELMYILMTFGETYIQLQAFWKIWAAAIREVNGFTSPQYLSGHLSRWEVFCMVVMLAPERALSWNFFQLFLVLIFYSAFTLLKNIAVTIKLFLSFGVGRGMFDTINMISLTISTQLIQIWAYIIYYSWAAQVSIKDGQDESLSYVSFLANEYQLYSALACVNTLFVFARIFQYFSFSPQLSVFTEIIRSASNDLVYFMMMFAIFLWGFSLTGFLLFGSQLKEYEDNLSSIIELFKVMNFSFDQGPLIEADEYGGLFFVSFMALFTFFLLNMFVALIVAHHRELMKLQAESEDEEEENVFSKLIFQVAKETLCPERLAQSDRPWVRAYHARWHQLSTYINQKKEVETFDYVEEERRVIQTILTTKFSAPTYEEKDINRFLKPYLGMQMQPLATEASEEESTDYKMQ